MALMNYCCCCINLRKGTMASASVSLILSVLAALGYVWTLLEFVAYEYTLTDAHYLAGWIINLCLVLLQVFMIVNCFILFIGVFCWSDGAALFYLVITVITYTAELGCIIYVGYIHSDQLGGLEDNTFVIAEIAFYVFRLLFHFYVVLVAFSFYEYINERRQKYADNR